MRVAGTIALWCCCLLAACTAPIEKPLDPVVVEDAWLRSPPPGLDKTAGYFRLVNQRSEPIALVSASSDQARAVEMHTTILEGDMMRMRRLEIIPIPAGETVTFEPGGKHLMVFGLHTAEAVTISLRFQDGTTRVVPFTWR